MFVNWTLPSFGHTTGGDWVTGREAAAGQESAASGRSTVPQWGFEITGTDQPRPQLGFLSHL